MENRKIITINETDCTGCGACANICPVSAITMCENKEGFLVPKVDEEKCIDCGLCDRHCPVLSNRKNENQTLAVYAAAANDDIRMKSSSGGIFSVLAEKILEEGGYVCGASFDDDFMGVSHIIISDKAGLEKLQGSKYVQSATGDVYRKIKELLEAGEKVLFSGCPCQVAGIKTFLGKTYEYLYTIDILCHEVPSPKAFRSYVKSEVMRRQENKKIEKFSFRDKEHGGWAPSVYVEFQGGYCFSKAKTETSWYSSFLNILNCRKSCGACRFNRIPREGDITLGDFWGIREVSETLNDGKGVSVVTVNNEKGKAFFEAVKHFIPKVMETTIEVAAAKNGNLVRSSKSHQYRKRFFRLLDQYDNYGKITTYALKRKFDIGFVGWWYGKNYGSVMTNYALEHYLESENYSVLMLEWPEKVKSKGALEDSFARRFAKKHYEISARRTYDELPQLNSYCDMFLVGSDQLWNYWSTKNNGAYFFLDFVEDSKKKIAYATSFGHPSYGAPNSVLKENAYFLNQFDAVSVREQDGIGICRDIFGVDAVCNVDPVFLCEESEYDELIIDSKVNETRKYIMAYILTPSKEKRTAILEIAKALELPVILILDAQKNQEENRLIMNMPEALRENLEMEDWLYYIKNAELVLTDSYHGLCFSLIFRRDFVCFANIKRGMSRFETILRMTNLEQRMLFQPMDAVEKRVYAEKIDYKEVWAKLQPEIERSKIWLDAVLAAPKINRASVYDILMERIKDLERKVTELVKES